MACDMSRLISNKSFFSFDSVGFITSNANDYGFDNIFTRWMETIALAQDYDSTMVIGLSCSGRSKNVLNGLSGQKRIGACHLDDFWNKETRRFSYS